MQLYDVIPQHVFNGHTDPKSLGTPKDAPEPLKPMYSVDDAKTFKIIVDAKGAFP